ICVLFFYFFFQAEDGIRDRNVTGVQTCALPILRLQRYVLWQRSLKPKEGASTIHVDEVALKVAAFYEQLRTIVDWKEEHLMRRRSEERRVGKECRSRGAKYD